MNAAITALLALLQALMPMLTSATSVQSVINALVQIIPVLVKEFQDVVPIIKNIIAALSENPATTEEQLAELAKLDEKVDAEFEAAAAAAQAEDAAS